MATFPVCRWHPQGGGLYHGTSYAKAVLSCVLPIFVVVDGDLLHFAPVLTASRQSAAIDAYMMRSDAFRFCMFARKKLPRVSIGSGDY